MPAVALIVLGVAALAALLVVETREARERGLTSAMESVLCAGATCDIEGSLGEQ